MNSNELMAVLKCMLKDEKIKNYGVVPADQFEYVLKKSAPKVYIVNTKPASIYMGHWVCIFELEKNVLEFFDPLAFDISVYGKYFLPLLKFNPLVNSFRIQSLSSIQCGKFVTFYLYYRLRDNSMCKIVNQFSCNRKMNDKKVIKFYKSHFSNVKICSVKPNQCCCSHIKLLRNKIIY